ncbi:MAG: DUF484 family protein [Motiliproteus sp.]|nr:DUF484 family protein [Motiliproteus sp.]MCW9051443.1 DUF484 family protein [Motiliproteus sp.]
MSDQQTNSSKQGGEVSEQQVVDFLKQHPEFFNQHQHLLEDLHIPHQRAGTVSLVERQTSILRQQNRAMNAQIDELIDTARHNDLQFDKTRRLIINLLEAHNLDEAIVAIDEGLCQNFNGDVVQLILFGDPNALQANNLKVVTREEADPHLADLIESDWAICGSLNDKERHFLFDDRASKVLSAAAVPLVCGKPIGFLAIGSFEANYFHSSMGTLFLNYIGEVLSRVCYRLAGPEQLD